MCRRLKWTGVVALLVCAMMLVTTGAQAQMNPVKPEQLGTRVIDTALETALDKAFAPEEGSVEPVDRATLRKGSTGAEVVQLQQNLTSLGYYTGAITGYFDDATEQAVRQLQFMNGLGVDGVVGSATQMKIIELLQRLGITTGGQTGSSTVQDFLVDTSVTLNYGKRSTNVQKLQNALKALGYYPLSSDVTGYYGGTTTEAVKAFQRDYGLTVDGIAGKNTLEMINYVLSNTYMTVDTITMGMAVVGSPYTVSYRDKVHGALGTLAAETTIYLNGQMYLTSDQMEFQFIPTQVGTYIIRVTFRDQVGRTAQQDITLQAVEAVPINISLTTPAEMPVGYQAVTTVTATGGLSSDYTYNYYLFTSAGLAVQSYVGIKGNACAFPIYQAGMYLIRVDVTDGYTVVSQNSDWFQVKADTPLYVSLSNVDNSLVGAGPVTATATVSSNLQNAFAYNFYLFNSDGVIVQQREGVYDKTISFNVSAEGIYLIRVVATDGYHVNYADSNWFSVTGASPLQANIDTPSGAVAGTAFSAKATVSGGLGGYRYNFYLYDASFKVTDSKMNQNQSTVSFTIPTAGIYLIRAEVTDGRNTTTADTSWFAVMPSNGLSIRSVTLSEANIPLGSSMTVTATVSGGVSQNYTYNFNLVDVTGTIYMSSLGVRSNTWTFTPAKDGMYVVFVNVSDGQGSVSEYSAWFRAYTVSGAIAADEDEDESVPPVLIEEAEAVEVMTPDMAVEPEEVPEMPEAPEMPEVPVEPETSMETVEPDAPAEPEAPVLELVPESVEIVTPEMV